MTVQDLLKQCDFDVQTKLICNRQPSYEDPYDPVKVKAAQEKFVNMLLSLEAKPSKDFILFERCWWDEDDSIVETVEAELYEYDDFKENGKYVLESGFVYRNVQEDWSVSELKKKISEYPLPPQAFAYEFNEWEQTLGYQVYEENLKDFDVQQCLYAVLYEMSFNGMDRDSQIERREELESSVKELDEILELPEEERSTRLHSFDELMDEFGYKDTRTVEEKDEDTRRMYYCSLKCRYEKYKNVMSLYDIIVRD